MVSYFSRRKTIRFGAPFNSESAGPLQNVPFLKDSVVVFFWDTIITFCDIFTLIPDTFVDTTHS